MTPPRLRLLVLTGLLLGAAPARRAHGRRDLPDTQAPHPL